MLHLYHSWNPTLFAVLIHHRNDNQRRVDLGQMVERSSRLFSAAVSWTRRTDSRDAGGVSIEEIGLGTGSDHIRKEARMVKIQSFCASLRLIGRAEGNRGTISGMFASES